ncbi:hypothetical protein CRG98_043029 [Punica granatum]|uniref:Uncharacterized protein n=1 Tax=Punica granatum TaxID=22663 RepID=A0A2I0HY30_PUNGR|nr:hypothetical protein CRG98_043029 [Punica granatum]
MDRGDRNQEKEDVRGHLKLQHLQLWRLYLHPSFPIEWWLPYSLILSFPGFGILDLGDGGGVHSYSELVLGHRPVQFEGGASYGNKRRNYKPRCYEKSFLAEELVEAKLEETTTLKEGKENVSRRCNLVYYNCDKKVTEGYAATTGHEEEEHWDDDSITSS